MSTSLNGSNALNAPLVESLNVTADTASEMNSPQTSPRPTILKGKGVKRFAAAVHKVQNLNSFESVMSRRKHHVMETASAIFSGGRIVGTTTIELNETWVPPTPTEPCTTVKQVCHFLRAALDKTINTPWTKDLAPFLMCVVALSLAIFMERVSDGASPIFYATHNLQQTIVNRKFTTTHGRDLIFQDITNDVEYFAWLTGPLASTLLDDDAKGDSSVDSVNIPVGIVTIRQMRAIAMPCLRDGVLQGLTMPIRNATTSNVSSIYCYRQFDPRVSATTPYRGFFSDADRMAMKNKSMGWPPLYDAIGGVVRDYPDKSRDQYSVTFPVNTTREGFLAIVSNLRNNSWLDDATRVVSVEMLFFNINMECFFVCKFTVEVTDGGSYETWSSLRPLVLFPYAEDYVFLIAVHSLLILYFIYDMYRLVQRLAFTWVYHRRVLLLFGFWNVVIVVHNVNFWIATHAKIQLLLFSWELQSENFADNHAAEINERGGDFNVFATEVFARGASLYDTTYSTIGFVAMIGWLRLLLYVEHVPKLNLVSLTVRMAIAPLLGVMFLMFVIVMGFAIMGHLMYGNAMEEFRTYNTAACTLCMCLLGGFPNWNYMDKLRPGLVTLFYFGTFLGVCWCVLLNIVLAIITDAFYKTKAQAEYKDQDAQTLLVSLGRLEHFLARSTHNLLKALRLDRLALFFSAHSTLHDDEHSVFGAMDEIHSLTFKLRDTITTVRNFREISNVVVLLESWMEKGKGDELIYFVTFKRTMAGTAQIKLLDLQWTLIMKFINEKYARDVRVLNGSNSPGPGFDAFIRSHLDEELTETHVSRPPLDDEDDGPSSRSGSVFAVSMRGRSATARAMREVAKVREEKESLQVMAKHMHRVSMHLPQAHQEPPAEEERAVPIPE